MIDPRDEMVKSEDELTGDENEELQDLQKEYELKKQELLNRKREQQLLADKFVQGLQNQAKPKKTVDYSKRFFEFNNAGGKNQSCDEPDPLTKEPLSSKNDHLLDIVTELQTRQIKLLNVKKCLAKIVKPHYPEPNYDNWGFIGYVVDKSNLLKTVKNETYLRFRIGTFNTTINVNLFGEAYKKYWNLMVGELVIILNPNIFKSTKGFDFFLTENWNSLLSLGIIKNMGKCSDPECNKHINKQLTYCDYHEMKRETKFLKNKRMELNGATKLFNPMERSLNEESNIYTRKSEFNQSKYHDENIFNNAGTKRKLQDEKSNKMLEERLAKLLNNSRYEKIGLLKNVKTDNKVHKARQLSNNESLKQELKGLTKGKQVNLGMSKRDKLNKINKWNENMKKIHLQPTTTKPLLPHVKPRSSPGASQAHNHRPRLGAAPGAGPVTDDSESDSDLDIEFNSKDQVDQYKSLQKVSDF